MKLKFLLISMFLLNGQLSIILAQNKNITADYSSPENIINQYIKNDLEGDRLSSKTWKTKIYPFYYDNRTDEPGWDTITVVNGFNILNTASKNGDSSVNVKYNVLSDIVNNKLVASKTKSTVVYALKLKNGIWKLDGYKTCPIISKETGINYFSNLTNKSKDNELKKQYNKLLNNLRDLK